MLKLINYYQFIFLALMCISCDSDKSNGQVKKLNCKFFQKSKAELNIVNITFVCTSVKDYKELEDSIDELMKPVGCDDRIYVFMPSIRNIKIGSQPLWECIPLKSDGNINGKNNLSRATSKAVKNIQWDVLKDTTTYKSNESNAFVKQYAKQFPNAIYYSQSDLDSLFSIKSVNSISKLRDLFTSKICEGVNNLSILLQTSNEAIIADEEITSDNFVFSDLALTEKKNIENFDDRIKELELYKKNLINSLKNEPTDWKLLYLLARAELLINSKEEKSLNDAVDNLIKASHEAFNSNDSEELLALINKHQHEAFKSLLDKEGERKWKIESCKTGLKKNKREYLATSINYMKSDTKGKRVVNIDPDQIYNHIGKYNKRFSIGIVNYDPESTNCTLNFTYPGEPSNFNTRISLSKFEEKEIDVNDELRVILRNQSTVNNDFVTLSYKEKKKETKNDYSGIGAITETTGGEETEESDKTDDIEDDEIVNVDSDNDGIIDSDDDCPQRYSQVNNGCPELNIKLLSSIRKNLPQTFEVTYEQNRSNDRVLWESSDSVNIVGAQNVKPSIEFPNVGKYPVSVSVNNFSDDFYLNKSIDVYVKVGVAELEELFNHIIRYGNDGKTVKGTSEQREYFINTIAPKADKALEKLYKMCDSKAIPIMRSKSTSKLEVMVRRFKEPKSINTTINDFEITDIEYSKETGLINKIVYNFKS